MIESAFPIITRDGAAIQMMRWSQSGEKPHLHWAHATGFNAKTYTPLLLELLPHFDVHTWDMRGRSQAGGGPN